MSSQQKKRHHYVPITYLSRFTDPQGRTFAYQKDDPASPLHVRPREIAFERYYYSQPLPEGGQDNNKLEDLFSELESHWPSLVDGLAARRDVHNQMEALFQFMGLLRARVSGFTQQYISDLERGRRNPTVVTLFELAQALGSTPVELITPDGHQ